ncbi:MAG: pyridoxamine 5'-phosphate oxidase [Acidimicrobiia bacterium]
MAAGPDPESPPLDPESVDPDPLVQFERWYGEARAAGVRQPDAMTLATVSERGSPAARTVLLRGLDARGFAFFTNLESAKAREILARPSAALVFHWREVERQVRVTGPVSRLPVADETGYWHERPRGHRISAWASPQSEVVDAADLEARVAEVESRFVAQEPPLPPFWGGYVVGIETLELWQGRTERLHDRVRYRRLAGTWIRERLAP